GGRGVGGGAPGPPTTPAAPVAGGARGTPTPTAVPWPTPTRVVPGEIRLAGGSPGSPYDAYARALAAVWAARLPGLKVTVLSTGGPADNLRLLDAGQAEVALSRDDLATMAANKTPPFTQDHPIRVATIAALYQEWIQILVAADSQIQTSRGLVGQRVSTPPFDSAANVTLWQALTVGTFKPEDFRQMFQVPDDTAAALYVEKRTDVMLTVAAGPVAALQQAAQQRPVRLLPVSDSWREQIQSRHSFFYDATIPAGTYQGQEQPVNTLGPRGILVGRRDLPVDLTYVLAKALVEGKDDLAARSPLGALFIPQEVTQRVETPFHVGAVDYYREAGLSK
ncbi:MAG: TAXI family TRAP transporter solute-binding subunit, partial [Chloroflexota bacterium]